MALESAHRMQLQVPLIQNYEVSSSDMAMTFTHGLYILDTHLHVLWSDSFFLASKMLTHGLLFYLWAHLVARAKENLRWFYPLSGCRRV